MPKDFYPMTMAELFDRALHVYKQSFWRQIAYGAIVSLIAFVGLFALSIISVILMVSTGASGFSVVLVVIIAAAGVLLWLSVSSAGHILLARHALYGHKAKITVYQIPAVALRVFSVFFALIIAFLPIGFLAVLVFSVFINAPTINIWVLVIVGVLFSLVFYLFISVFSLAFPVAVFENKCFFAALSRAWALVKGEFWKIVATRVMWALITFLLTSVLQGGLQIFTFALAMFPDIFGTSPTGAYGLITALGQIVGFLSIIATIITTPLEGVFTSTMYFNQRIKKEGLDIDIALGRLRL